MRKGVFTMEKMKESSVYKMVLLGVLCAVCGLFLSVVNSITAPIIAENALATVKDSLEIIYPGAEFTDVTEDYIAEDTTGHIDAIYTAGDEGVIFTLNGTGYSSSGLTFMVGFDSEGVISGFVPLESSETDGFGSRVFEEDFYSTYVGVAEGDEIPMLSGATLTSTAVRDGIEAAQALLPSILGN